MAQFLATLIISSDKSAVFNSHHLPDWVSEQLDLLARHANSFAPGSQLILIVEPCSSLTLKFVLTELSCTLYRKRCNVVSLITSLYKPDYFETRHLIENCMSFQHVSYTLHTEPQTIGLCRLSHGKLKSQTLSDKIYTFKKKEAIDLHI